MTMMLPLSLKVSAVVTVVGHIVTAEAFVSVSSSSSFLSSPSLSPSFSLQCSGRSRRTSTAPATAARGMTRLLGHDDMYEDEVQEVTPAPGVLHKDDGTKDRSSIHENSGNIINRRRLFSEVVLRASSSTAAVIAACGCSSCFAPRAAYGLAQIAPPSPEALSSFDPPRNPFQDEAFAQGMAVGMVDYEREAFPVKKRLFQTLFRSLGQEGLTTVQLSEVDFLAKQNANAKGGLPEKGGGEEPVVVEVGMGSFPNALYYKNSRGLDIIGIDPNDRMEGYARDSASRAGLLPRNSFRVVHGVSEALPLADNSCDAVVCTLTLCSVIDPAKSIAEIGRVLKPGGKFLFWEHVLSETDVALARQQVQTTPAQVIRADGCHLDRRTGDVIRGAGFRSLDLEYLELKNFGFLNPTVCGIATA